MIDWKYGNYTLLFWVIFIGVSAPTQLISNFWLQISSVVIVLVIALVIDHFFRVKHPEYNWYDHKLSKGWKFPFIFVVALFIYMFVLNRYEDLSGIGNYLIIMGFAGILNTAKAYFSPLKNK